MHIHILGICGTFMGGVAVLARALGYRVTGSDAHVYPPMSELLRAEGIVVREGYEPSALEPEPDCVVIGNVLTRGNPLVEHVLDRDLRLMSGPQWLARHVLEGRWVVAVAGTHGKTTTTGMLAGILEAAGRRPGFLVGGVPKDFAASARLGARDGPFVVEADEYDSAFFDKRSKFVHYRARTSIITNIEFDHADIFDDLKAIRRQFHHMVRTLPSGGLIVRPRDDAEVDTVMSLGCWTATTTFGLREGDWTAAAIAADGSSFDVVRGGQVVGRIEWDLLGEHNVLNAIAAVAAADHAGVDARSACEALSGFQGVKRRLELIGCIGGVSVYDDFAHHPTAIATTLRGLRRRVGDARILTLIDPASNTMRMGVHRDTLAPALRDADLAWIYRTPQLQWDPALMRAPARTSIHVQDSADAIVEQCAAHAAPGSHIVVMSNSSFEGVHERLLSRLRDNLRAGG